MTDATVEAEPSGSSEASEPTGGAAGDAPRTETAEIPRQQSAETAADRESGEGAHP
ncbi:gliding motility protein [Streptomyces odontomachi]|uniref:gliding motility protein n=1 Tax=Streptomyces odontomachi TaxID=2944940 RepID=UPI00210A68FF|nr:gliding motility protein [Streptomyces sp. ODS25]